MKCQGLIGLCSTQGGVAQAKLISVLCSLYFKHTIRKHPVTGNYSGYFRLVES